MHYLEQAGTEALLRYAHSAVADYFRRAIERTARAGGRPDSASTQEQLVSALYRAARYDETIATLERAVELYRTQDDDEGMQRAVGRLAETHYRRGTVPEDSDQIAALTEDEPIEQTGSGSRGTIALREGVLRLLVGKASHTQLLTAGRSLARVGRATRNARLLTMGERAEGAARILQGRLTEGAAVLERTLQREPAPGEGERDAELALLLSGVYVAMGALEPAQALSRRMLALAEAGGDPVTTTAHSASLGSALHLQGDWDAAHRSFQRADALAATAEPSSIAVRMAAVRAPCLIWEGAFEQARHYLNRTLQHARAMRLEPTERIALSLLAQLDVLEGQAPAAVERLAPLVDTGVTWHVAVLLPTTLASAYLLLDEVPRAAPLAERAVAEARWLGVWPAGVDALRVRALVAIRQGDAEQAGRLLREALQHARSIPFPYAEARLLETSALLDRQHGDDASVHASLAEARAIYARLGAQRDVTQLRSPSLP